MKKSIDYHSAFQPEIPIQDYETRLEHDGNTIFVHDLFEPFPGEYDKCDVFYAETPWDTGFDNFEKRVGKEGRTFEGLNIKLRKIILEVRRPFIIVAGIKTAIGLPIPTQMVRTEFVTSGQSTQAKAWAYCYRIKFEKYDSTDTILNTLAKRYECIGDFCCGYGNVGMLFRRAGKRFVMSDYNPRAVGVAIRNYKDYENIP